MFCVLILMCLCHLLGDGYLHVLWRVDVFCVLILMCLCHLLGDGYLHVLWRVDVFCVLIWCVCVVSLVMVFSLLCFISIRLLPLYFLIGTMVTN